jgi:hypothetical protein
VEHLEISHQEVQDSSGTNGSSRSSGTNSQERYRDSSGTSEYKWIIRKCGISKAGMGTNGSSG